MWWWSQASCWTVWETPGRIQRTAAVRVQGVELRPQLRLRLTGEQPHDLDQLRVVRIALPAVRNLARDAVACVRRSRLFESRLRAPHHLPCVRGLPQKVAIYRGGSATGRGSSKPQNIAFYQ